MQRASLLITLSLCLAACQSNGAGNTEPGQGDTTAAAGTTENVPEKQSFSEWLDDLRDEAMAAGVSGDTFDSAFAAVRVNPEIVAKDRDQSEFTKPVWSYLDSAVSPERVANGKIKEAEQQIQLNAAAKRYGVPAEIILAIWGLESAYGANTGGYNVIEALATLAYDGRRPQVFREQLIDALLILEAGDIEAAAMRGSWAGAMGQTQFMPSAFRQYAVDGDNDGKRDIWGDHADVFGSTANYLVKKGWRAGESWGAEVKLPRDFPWEQAEIDIKKPVTEWRKLGVRLANGAELPAVASPASIITPAGHRGPAFIVYRELPHHPGLQLLLGLCAGGRASGRPHRRRRAADGELAAGRSAADQGPAGRTAGAARRSRLRSRRRRWRGGSEDAHGAPPVSALDRRDSRRLSDVAVAAAAQGERAVVSRRGG